MIHLTAKQGRILVAAICSGIQDRQSLIDAYAPEYAKPDAHSRKIIRSIQREIVRYIAVRREIFTQMPERKKAKPCRP